MKTPDMLREQIAERRKQIEVRATVAKAAAGEARKAETAYRKALDPHQKLVEAHREASDAFEAAAPDARDAASVRIARLEREVALSARDLAPLESEASRTRASADAKAAALSDAKQEADALERELELLEEASPEQLDRAMGPKLRRLELAAREYLAAAADVSAEYMAGCKRVDDYNATAKPEVPLPKPDGARAAVSLYESFAAQGVILGDPGDHYLKDARVALEGSNHAPPGLVARPWVFLEVLAVAILRPPVASPSTLEARRMLLSALCQTPNVHAAHALFRGNVERAQLEAAEAASPAPPRSYGNPRAIAEERRSGPGGGRLQ